MMQLVAERGIWAGKKKMCGDIRENGLEGQMDIDPMGEEEEQGYVRW